MLDTQYRMLPEIAAFPSKTFYHGKLKNGQNVNREGYRPLYLGGTCASAGRIGLRPLLKPFIFFDLLSSQDEVGVAVAASSSQSQSRSNPEEARFCVSLVKTLLVEANRTEESIGSIGVITPYQDQLSVLRREFINHGLLRLQCIIV